MTEPVFYKCFANSGLRHLCIVVCTFNVLFEVFFVWILGASAIDGKAAALGLAWWVNIWYVLPARAIHIVNVVVFLGVEVALTLFGMALLLMGAITMNCNLVLASSYTQLVVLLVEASFMCFMLFWHQMINSAHGFIYIACFLWLRTLFYFVTTSYADQIKRKGRFDNTNFIMNSFVMSHLRRRAEAARRVWATTAQPEAGQ